MKKPKDKNGVEQLGHLSDTKRYFLCEIFKSEFAQYQRKRGSNEYSIAPTRVKKY